MTSDTLNAARSEQIRRGLLGWYQANARDLPWRHTRDPYAILVSEIMLQQTQVDRVVPYYEHFLERFPTVESLAAAPTADVIRLWSGLGYNRRAVNLQRAAQVVAREWQGVFPDDPARLRTLPGIGAYTAGAVAAFAFERDVAFLDTNMRRVVNRLALGSEPASETVVLSVAEALLPAGGGWKWNQALIEFGALQCTARTPACIVCPVQRACAAFPTVQSSLARQRKINKGGAAPFETTSRYYRGKIVETLRALPENDATGIDLLQLGPQVRENFSRDDIPWLRSLVEGLQRDGLAVVTEDRPAYDGEVATNAGLSRVRLP